MPIFSPPHAKRVTLSRPIFVKGKGMPKAGICLFSKGETVTALTENGFEWYILGRYNKKTIKVAVLPNML